MTQIEEKLPRLVILRAFTNDCVFIGQSTVCIEVTKLINNNFQHKIKNICKDILKLSSCMISDI